MRDQEEWLADTLVGLADTLVADFDLVDFLSMLAERLVEFLDAADVGLVLADRRGNLRVMAASSERTRTLELFELQSQEGPCLDSYRSGQQLVNVDLDAEQERWPVFVPEATATGFHFAHALPMRLRDEVIGAVNIFHVTQRTLSPSEVRLTQALADVATIGILQERAVREVTDVAAQLQGALNSRIVIEQAKGVVAEHLKVDMDGAFALLRGYARSHNLRLGDVAGSVVGRRLAAETLQSAKAPRRSGSRPAGARPQ